jgi:hypothetical protein
MEDTIIWQQIQKYNKILRWYNLIGIALLLAFSGLQYQYLRNCFLGPQRVDAKQLSKIKDSNQLERDFVTFTTPQTLEIGSEIRTNKYQNKTITTKYAIAVVGSEKLLLISGQPNDNFKNHTFTGKISTIPADVQSELIDKIIKDEPQLKDKILPLMLESEDYQLWLYILLPTLAGGFGICSWNIYQVKVRTNNPRKHPIYKSLASYGSGDLLANSIDSEFKTYYGDRALNNDPYYLTPSWLIFPRTYSLKIIKLDRLMWVFKKVTNHSVNFIPTGKSYEMVIYDRSGIEHQLSLSEQQVDLLIEDINRYAPGAVLGFTREIQSMWDNQRQEFYALVEQQQSVNYRSHPKTERTSTTQKAQNIVTEIATSSPDRVYPETRQRVNTLAGYDKKCIERLLSSARVSHPKKSEQWYWDKILYDLERDRGF